MASEPDFHITITGPGLVINDLALGVINHLIEVGERFEVEDWDGLEQHPEQYELLQDFRAEQKEVDEELAGDTVDSSLVKVVVKPLPWGG